MALPLPNFQELGRDIKERLDTLETDVSTKISTADANATFLPIKGKAESAKIADSATTADKLTTSSNFSISGGATAAGVAYNGTADVQLVVTSIDGTKVTGSVPSATKATQDAAGNVIATTYAKQSQLPTVMGAASAAAAGSSGLVPQPAAGSNTKFLRGDATWQTVTDPTVTQNSTTIDGSLPILIKNSATSAAETGPVKYATTVTVNPSTSTITATNFAGTASKAIADKSGNDITTTYAKQADLTASTGRIDNIENTTVRLTGDVTGSATIGTTGSVSISATIANSGVTAGTYGPTGNKTLAYGDTFTVPSVTVNAKGQTTAGATRTFTLPAAQDLSDYAKTADLPTTMVGATGSAGGKSGLVPASSAGDQNKVLSAGGTWVEQSTQQQVDWNASSGITSIANKPTLGALATKNSVAYSEVTGTPDLSVYHTVSDFNTFKSANDTALGSKANKSDVYTKSEVDSKLTSVYTYKGSVANEAALPTTGQKVGDVYNIEDTGMNVAWTANGWDKLGSVVDLSPYAKTADVYSKTVADSTFLTQSNAASTYATVTTVNGVTNRVSTLEGKAVNMKGATSSAAGAAGFVPQPIAGDQAKFLRGDGTWAETPNATYTGGAGITVSGSTITNAGVRSVTAGAAANQISVNTNGTTNTITVNNVAKATAADSATKATQDSAGQQIDTTYIKGLAVSGKTITYTKGDDTTGTITTQDTTYTSMTGATASAAGKSGLVPAPAAGDQLKFLRADGTWVVPTDTKYSVMGSATASTGGTSGLVPASAAGDQLKFLRADGTWVVPTDTKYTAGTGIALDGTTFSNAGVCSVTAGASANQISVNTGGTTSTITVNNVANATAATKATQDSAGQQINKTYIKDLSVNGTTITFKRGDDTTGTITTQDTDTKYTAGTGIGISGTTITNAGVRTVKAGTNANQIVVDTNGTSNTITVNNVANATAASKLATARTVTLAGDVTGSTTFDGSADVTITVTVADDSHNHVIANVDGLQGALDAKAPLASPALTGTPTAPTAGVATNNTQIATTAFVQAAINEKIASADAMIYKGTIGNAASGATITALPATHSVGWTYKVITAGTYAGKTCEVGDMIICLTAGTVASDSDWSVVQSNIDGAVTGPASSVDAHVATFNGTTGKVIKDSGFTIGTSVPANAKFTDTTYTAGTGIDVSGTTITNAGVRSVTAGSNANQISVNTNGTTNTITVNNVANATAADSATKATQDSAGQQIDTTYIKGLAVSGRTITYTKGDGTTDSFNTQDTTYGSMTGATASTAGGTGLVPAPTAGAQDKYLKGDGTWGTPTDTKYTAGTGIDLSGTTFSNSGVRSVKAGTSANQISVDTGGTTTTITVDNVGKATRATQDSAGQQINTTYIKGLSVNGKVITYTKGDGTTGTITTQDTNTTYAAAKYNTLGLIKPSKTYTTAATLTTTAASADNAVTVNAITTNSGRYYAVESDSNGIPFVNVPWQNTTYSAGTGISIADNVVTNTGVRSVAAGTNANQITVDTNGTTSTITVNNVANATTATKLGTTTVGSATKPFYLNAGTPTAFSSNLGGTAQPVYMAAGELKALSANVGSATVPVYLKAGVITQCDTTLGVSITGTAAKATADAAGNTIATTYAKLASPALTGTPTAPTAAVGTNTTQLATTAFVQNEIADQMEVFVATYNETSFADVLAAHNAGKVCYCKSGEYLYPLMQASANTIRFINLQNATVATSIVVTSDNAWSTQSLSLNVSGQTANRVLVTDGSGHGTTSSVTTTELGYLSGVTSSVQTQLNNLSSTASTKAPLASPALTGTPTAPTAGASTDNTQIATTAFVQAAINAKIAASDAMIYKGTIGSTGATVTALPTTHSVGWTYKVVTAGTYAGKVCEVGDMIICLIAGTTADNTHWTVVQSNIDGAVTGPASSVDAHVATFNGTTGKVIKDSGFTIGTSVPANAKFTDTTYTAGAGIGISGTTITNTGVRSVAAGSSANQITVNTNGTSSTITVNNVAKATAADSATKATQDSTGQQINTTYIKGLAVSGKTITYTKGDDTTGTITTQDTTYSVMGAATSSAAGTNGLVPAPAAGKQSSFLRGDGTWVVPTDTKYTASNGIALSGTVFSNSGVRSIAAGSSANQLVVDTNGTSATITINNVANATNASKAAQLTTARTIDGVSFNGTANIVHYGSCSTAAATVEKVVACTGFTLATGARIIVKFTVTNTAAKPTLNVNSTGAKAIYYRGAAISTGYLAANRTYQFIYNGTQYELVGDINTDTNTKVTQTLTTTNAEYSILGMADAAATANKTNTTRFSTGITMNPSTNTITASVLKGSLDGSYLTGTIDGGELT